MGQAWDRSACAALSCMGKTRYALSLVGIGRALELNMACAVEPDLHARSKSVV